MENIKLLLYCCKDKRGYLHFDTRPEITRKYYLSPDSSPFGTYEPNNYLNGKILLECDFEVEKIFQEFENKTHRTGLFWYQTNNLTEKELLERSGLTMTELSEYLEPLEQKYIYGKGWQIKPNGYAIYIKNLKERIMKLSDVYKYDHSYDNMFGWIAEENEKYIPLDKAPQNMCRVWIYENGKWVMYILISVRPEWMCLILNKDKDVELRKKVLKGMI